MKKVAILNIEQFEKQNNLEGFYSNTLENHLVTSHKDIYLPHSHNFYLAILFTHGSGMHEVDFTTYIVQPGSIFFLNPGQTHHWELSDDTKGYIFFHTQSFYDLQYTQATVNRFPFYYSMHNLPCLYLTGNNLNIITTLFADIYNESLTEQPLKRQKLLSLINLVYIENTRLYLNQNPADEKNRNNYYNKFRQLEQLVDEHFKTEKTPAHYAEILNISAKHLNRISQAVAGKAVTDIIHERILLEAKKELVLQKKNFGEIAYALGYTDYAYFSRLFKKKTGETPSQFLQRYIKSS